MTISTTTSRIPYNGNGVTTIFAVPFRFFANTDLVVQLVTVSTGASSTLTLGTHYTVTGADDEDGGSLTMVTAPAVGQRLVIRRVIPATQEVDYVAGDPFPAETHERALDRLTMLAQQGEEVNARALVFPAGDTASGELPAVASRANRLIGFDAEGNLVVSAPASGSSASGSSAELALALAGTGGAGLVGTADGQTVEERLRDSRSILSWVTSPALRNLIRTRGTFSAGDRTALYSAIQTAWASALANNHDLYAPAGLYDVGANSLPFGRIDGSPPASLLDCRNVTVYGDGPLTEFKTTSAGGADVLQINGARNFHARNFRVTAALTGSAGSGSNGISVTGGFDNITLLDVWADDCPGLDKTTYVDGGKALTIQCDAATLEVGSLKARIFAKRCAQGFGFEAGLTNFLTKKVAVDVDVVAEDCFKAVTINAPEATSALPDGTHTGVRVRGQAINCQQSVVAVRAHGVEVDVQVISTKTAAARRLNPSASAWFAADSTVVGLRCTYAKNSQIRVTGNMGACDYKARIGGIGAGSSGLNGRTQHCDIFLDLGGTAAVDAVDAVDSGGNTMSQSRLTVTSNTAATLPAAFYVANLQNVLTIGPSQRLVDSVFSGPLVLNQSAPGNVETGRIELNGSITALRGRGTSSAGQVVAGLYDNGGTLRLGILNGNGIVVDALGTTSAIGAYVGKQPVYNSAGVLLGWFPLYA